MQTWETSSTQNDTHTLEANLSETLLVANFSKGRTVGAGEVGEAEDGAVVCASFIIKLDTNSIFTRGLQVTDTYKSPNGVFLALHVWQFYTFCGYTVPHEHSTRSADTPHEQV